MDATPTDSELPAWQRHDPLTGLPSTAVLLDRAEMALARSERAGGQVAVLALGLDGFEAFAQAHGDAAAAELERAVAARLHFALRRTDTAVRSGPAQFVVLLPDQRDADEALAVAAKIHQGLAAPLQIGEVSVHTAASVGVAVHPQHGQAFVPLLEAAQAALQAARAAGSGVRRAA